MADNIIIPETLSGKVISTDDISGIHVQRMKIMLGDNGVDDGTLSLANPLPVDPIADQEGEDHDWNATRIIKIQRPDPLFSGTPFFVFADVDYLVLNAKGNITNLWAFNKGSTLLYVQIHNKTSVPTSGNTALFSYPLPAGASATIPAIVNLGKEVLGDNGIHCDTGMAIGISTAQGTFTAHGTAADVGLGGFYAA